MDLRGRRVLLTGASRGIGAELARAFRREGADLALVARPSEQLDDVTAEVGGAAYPCDLSDLAAIPDLVGRVETDGPIDVLVNNAGVSHVGWYLDRTLDEITQVVTVDLLAPLHLCRLVLPGMLARRRGHVVNVSSFAAVVAPPGLVAYGGAKAGLSHATAVMRADLRDEPIVFTTVHLGSVKTDMDDAAREYGPLRQLAERSRGYDITPMATLIDAIVRAIREGREQVRVPKGAAPLAVSVDLPRRLGALLFRRVPDRELRTDRP